jgi:2-C-methyl-D-erythritol 2,4-cyclodiphosphate synthase
VVKYIVMDIRVGCGYDVHALAEGLQLVLCGVKVPHTKGCVAHSDGDVAIHAICDALLGALALGDIGKLFPDSDAKYKGIDSRLLLKEVVELISSKGYAISNIDCTIAMQRPKLRPYIDTMRHTLSEVVGIDASRISIKATTTEHLGFEGREEGVSANAVTLLIKG